MCSIVVFYTLFVLLLNHLTAFIFVLLFFASIFNGRWLFLQIRHILFCSYVVLLLRIIYEVRVSEYLHTSDWGVARCVCQKLNYKISMSRSYFVLDFLAGWLFVCWLYTLVHIALNSNYLQAVSLPNLHSLRLFFCMNFNFKFETFL